MKLYHKKYIDSLYLRIFFQFFFSNVPNEHGRSFETFRTSLFLYYHTFTLENGCKVGQYFKNRLIFKLISFKPFNHFFIIFCIKIEYHKTFKILLSLFWKMPFSPQKGQKEQKWAERAVGQNQLFCILLNIGTLDFFDILHELKGIN